jgi:hypothetical protein
MRSLDFSPDMGVLLGDGLFLNNELTDGIADCTAPGFVDAKLQPAGDPGEHSLEQTGGDITDRFISAFASPTSWTAMDRPNERVIRFSNGSLLVRNLRENPGCSRKTKAKLSRERKHS